MTNNNCIIVFNVKFFIDYDISSILVPVVDQRTLYFILLKLFAIFDFTLYNYACHTIISIFPVYLIHI